MSKNAHTEDKVILSTVTSDDVVRDSEDDEEEHHVNRKKRMRENRKQILIWRVISYMSCRKVPDLNEKKNNFCCIYVSDCI